jgi:hypothetical protein
MIVQELEALRQFLSRSCAVNSYLGNRDRAVDELPLIEIVPTAFQMFDGANETMRFSVAEIQLRIIAGRSEEVRALSIMETVARKIGGFARSKGAVLEGTFTPEYSESRYSLTGSMTMRFRIHDED